LPGYSFFSVPRVDRAGGGVFLLLRKGFHVVQHPTSTFRSFELGDFSISSHAASMRLVIVYRMPRSKKNTATPATFLTEFSTYLEVLASAHSDNVLICGDFNFHVEDTTDHDAAKLCDLLVSASLYQHVEDATHDGGHTLDLLITPDEDSLIEDITIHILPTGDKLQHFATLCTVDIARPATSKEIVTVRKMQNINMESLKEDIRTSSLYLSPAESLNSHAEQYDNVHERTH
jgi:hypothetical protein